MNSQITVHLLDSAQGFPVQTWTFEDREAVTLGRAHDNDVVVADPYVSRAHAYLTYRSEQWRLIAISQQRIFHEGQTCAELPVGDGTVCRLGPHGCYLKFVTEAAEENSRATIAFDVTRTPLFMLDREKLEQEVDQITGAAYFEQLREAMRQRREQRQIEETKKD